MKHPTHSNILEDIKIYRNLDKSKKKAVSFVLTIIFYFGFFSLFLLFFNYYYPN